MSWVDDLFGNDTGNSSTNNENNNSNNTNNVALSDRDIALDMLIMSKSDITSLSGAITETTNPLLRQMLCTQLNNCINQHFRLSDMVISKQWYNAYATPQQQIQQDINEAKNLPQ